MFIQTGDTQLLTVSFGQSQQTILALGGWAGSWELWQGPFAHLSRTWRTVAFDHRGTGATIAPLESITVENMVADVFTVMHALGVTHGVLAAESAGATVALLAALQRPELFSGLVLVDGLIHHPADNENNLFLQSLKTDFEGTISRFVDMCVPEREAVAIRRWGRQILHRSEPAAAARLIECMAGIDLRSRVSEITIPTVIIHGSEDKIVPLSDALFLADEIPSAQLHVIDGAGHVPTMTHADEVAGIIDTYFDSNGKR